MAENNHNNNVQLNNGIMDVVQGNGPELISTTQVFTVQGSNLKDHKEQRQKKKKSHGNRKEQHKRRRLLRRQQQQQQQQNHANNNVEHNNDMDQNIIDQRQQDEERELIHDDRMASQQRITTENKRKRPGSTDNINVSRSFSQLSIIQRNSKKKKSTSRNNLSDNDAVHATANDNQQQHRDHNVEDMDHSSEESYMQQFKPRYLRVSDKIFKRVLSNTIDQDNNMVKNLDTKEKLELVRQVTEATNNLYYFDLQRQLWQEYYDIGMKENVWGQKISKSAAQQHRTCRASGLPQSIVEQRQQTIARQLQHVTNELKNCTIKLNNDAQHWQPPMDPTILLDAINELVKRAQRRLRQEFDYKKQMLVLDSNDHHLITKFYELKPNQEQTHLARKIWQTTADLLKTEEQVEILRKRIYLQRLPSGIDKIINQSIAPIQLLLSNCVINKDRGASLLSSCSKTITQYKFDLMVLNIDIIQSTGRGHQQLLDDLNEKLSQFCNESLIEAIENRQQAMRKRHGIQLKHKLHSFFDEAPTTSNE
ncbi:unnamed protein product [Rotaria socialis]|uniref:Uncharacterized protein n=1 Tax=Rotaria socialis TaxID=392032 RepID=A0A818CSF9_9BILA|nr:unnamed protein product [Rotaria socialis]CAF4723421.1 unnamed protein product [Rotaria socialis]